MRQLHLLGSVLWCIHGLRIFNDLNIQEDSIRFEDLLENPEGMDINAVQEWFLEFGTITSESVLKSFGVPMGDSECSTFTRSVTTMMVRFLGNVFFWQQNGSIPCRFANRRQAHAGCWHRMFTRPRNGLDPPRK